MLMIRLKRVGRRNDPAFHLVVGEKTKSPASGRHLADLGSYNPKSKKAAIDSAAALLWIKKGAQPSATVHNLFIKLGIITGKKINVLPKKTVAKPAEEAPAASAPAPKPEESTSATPSESGTAEEPAI